MPIFLLNVSLLVIFKLLSPSQAHKLFSMNLDNTNDKKIINKMIEE